MVAPGPVRTGPAGPEDVRGNKLVVQKGNREAGCNMKILFDVSDKLFEEAVLDDARCDTLLARLRRMRRYAVVAAATGICSVIGLSIWLAAVTLQLYQAPEADTSTIMHWFHTLDTPSIVAIAVFITAFIVGIFNVFIDADHGVKILLMFRAIRREALSPRLKVRRDADVSSPPTPILTVGQQDAASQRWLPWEQPPR